MHTLHWIAVEAGSKKEAEEIVTSELLNSDNRWWDWFDDSIGGRWGEEYKTIKLQYSDESAKVFGEILDRRRAEMDKCMEKIDLKAVSTLIDKYDGNAVSYPDSMTLWRLSNVAKLLGGSEYFCDSYFYDLVDWTTELNPLRERMANAQTRDRQYAVPIDFHY